VEGSVEVGTKKQAKGLLRHCMPILENTEEDGDGPTPPCHHSSAPKNLYALYILLLISIQTTLFAILARHTAKNQY
jgi:hypothetical protein